MRRAIWVVLLLVGLAPGTARAQGMKLCGGLALVCNQARVAAPAQPQARLLGLVAARRRGAELPPLRLSAEEHDALRGRPGPPAKGEARSVALFRQGYELERQGKYEEAKALYFELVQQFAGSAQAALAYVAFGERFLEGSGDDAGQLALARLCFERALAYADVAPAPRLYALLLLGRTLWAQGELVGAKQRLVDAARLGRGRSEAVVAAALAALPAAWAAASAAAAAEAEAKELAPAATRPLLEAAAEAFLDRGKPAEARRIYEALGQGASDERNCLYEARLLEVDRGDNRLPRASVVPRVREQLRRLEGQAGSEACAAATLEAGATLATELHQQAAGGDREAGKLASELYDALAEQGQPGLRFSRLPEALWPTPDRLRFAQGALAFSQGAWETCARAFGAVGSPEAGVYAGRCQARRVEASTPSLQARGAFGSEGREDPPRPLQPPEQEALDALDRAACLDDDEGPLRAAAARLLLGAGRLGEAAAELRAAAERASASDRAEAAARFLDVAGRAAARDDDCVIEAEAVRMAVFRDACAGRSRPGCAQLERLDSAIARARAAVLLRRAELGGLDAAELQEQAGRLLHDAARRCALDPIERREAPTCDRPEELLWGAAEAFAAARLPLKSIRVRLLLREPRFKLQRTDQARKSLVAIARSYEALADYEGAVSFYENFATEHPDDPEAAPALERAVTLRLALGQEPEAARGAEVLRSPAHRAHAARAASASLAIVQDHARRGAWEQASRRLDEAWPFLQEHASAPQRLVAQALRARLRLRQGQAADADYRKVIELWNRSNKPDDEPSLEAVGEALVHELALPRRSSPAPVFRGLSTVDALRRHLAGPLAAWLVQRRQGLAALDQAAEAVASHQPPLAPRWIAEARVRAFNAWASLSRDAEPSRWTGAAPLPAPLVRPVAELLEPLRERTTSAAWACVRSAIQAGSFDDGTAGCEQWLKRHGGYHPLDDSMLPRPGWVGTPPSERSSPLPPPRTEP